jgi:hypothetical protein
VPFLVTGHIFSKNMKVLFSTAKVSVLQLIRHFDIEFGPDVEIVLLVLLTSKFNQNV